MTTLNRTFTAQYTSGAVPGLDADRATIRAATCDADGTFTGSLLGLDADSETMPEMTQADPGRFTYTTTSSPFTRGTRYKAIIDIYVGGVLAQSHSQIFIAESRDAATRRADANLYTTRELRDYVLRSLGLGTSESGSEPGSADSLDIVNDALQNLWHAHEWTWLPADEYVINFAAGQYAYPLPAEFKALKSVHRFTDSYDCAIRASINDIRDMRLGGDNDVIPEDRVLYDIVYDPNERETEGGSYIIEVYPTPSAYQQNALSVRYLKDLGRLCADDEYPPFPASFTPLVKQACRCEAYRVENDARYETEQLIMDRMLAQAIRADALTEGSNLGSLVERSFFSTPWGRDHNRPLLGEFYYGD